MQAVDYEWPMNSQFWTIYHRDFGAVAIVQAATAEEAECKYPADLWTWRKKLTVRPSRDVDLNAVRLRAGMQKAA